MKKQIIITALIITAVFISACNNMSSGTTDNVKIVQEKTMGNIKVTILSTDGMIRSGSGSFKLEFRNASTGEGINAGNINAEVMMDMEGMTMMGEMSMGNMENMGHMMNMMENCNMNYNMPMKGSWKCTINFNGNQNVEFFLNVI